MYRHASSGSPPCGTSHRDTCETHTSSCALSYNIHHMNDMVQERDDLRKRTRQERLYSMRFNSFKSQLERDRHAIAIQ